MCHQKTKNNKKSQKQLVAFFRVCFFRMDFVHSLKEVIKQRFSFKLGTKFERKNYEKSV